MNKSTSVVADRMLNDKKAEMRHALSISLDSLEVEWVGQAELYFEHASEVADARLLVDELKNELELVYAELDGAIREDPEKFGLLKVTEAAIKGTIIQRNEYVVALGQLSDARHKLDLSQAMVTALDHRKKALEKLVELWSGNYFATPRAPANAKERMDTVSKESVRRRGQKR